MDIIGSLTAFFTLGTGLFLTVRLRFFQFTHLKKALLSPFERKKKKANGVTPFQAMATALGGSIGTANIAGVAGAIIIGGPGAVFWMWIAGLSGMAAKLGEIVLALKYRDASADPPAGGPMHYMVKGLGPKAFPLARAYALFGCMAGLVGTALVQSNTIALSISGLFPASQSAETELIRGVTGLVIAALTGLVIFGGAKRIGAFSERAVPFMAALYVLASIVCLILHHDRLLPAFREIISGAFGMRPIAGGLLGAGARRAFRVGIARGVYSNEAGVGSAALAHAGSSESDPVRQGMLGIFEVFADTLVMCSLTALVILTSGVSHAAFPGEEGGMALAGAAFSASFGGAAGAFLSVSVLLFAFTSLVGWSLYGEKCAVFLFGPMATSVFRLVFLLLIPAGSLIDAGLSWKIGELLNYAMAAPNLAALALLSGEIKKELGQYKMFEKSRVRHYNIGKKPL